MRRPSSPPSARSRSSPRLRSTAGRSDRLVRHGARARRILEANGLSARPHGITRGGLSACARADQGGGEAAEAEALKPDRIPVLPGGFAIMSASSSARPRLRRVTDGALRQGVLYDLLGRAASRHAHGDVEFTRRYDVDRAQATRVAALASASRPARRTRRRSRHEIRMGLEWAAMLHEIGISISHAGITSIRRTSETPTCRASRGWTRRGSRRSCSGTRASWARSRGGRATSGLAILSAARGARAPAPHRRRVSGHSGLASQTAGSMCGCPTIGSRSIRLPTTVSFRKRPNGRRWGGRIGWFIRGEGRCGVACLDRRPRRAAARQGLVFDRRCAGSLRVRARRP